MVHKNDMTQWNEIGCQRGCAEHATKSVTVKLGRPHGYADLTSIPERFAQRFTIDVWDTEKTPVDGGPYCPARDAVSETILSHGIWEPQETAVLMMAIEAIGPERCLFVDYGSQLGWFSTLAARMGAAVLPVEADPDCVHLAERNILRNQSPEAATMLHDERVTPDSKPWAVSDLLSDASVVAKIDIEGAEVDAVRMMQEWIDAGRVKYMLIEISPVFNDTYPDLVIGLVENGFIPYKLPPKQSPPIQIDSLEALRPFGVRGTYAEIKREVASWHQRDLLFVHGGL
jgi:hypothetical protein